MRVYTGKPQKVWCAESRCGDGAIFLDVQRVGTVIFNE